MILEVYDVSGSYTLLVDIPFVVLPWHSLDEDEDGNHVEQLFGLDGVVVLT